MSAIQIFPNPNLVRLEKPLPFSTNRSDDPKSLPSRIQSVSTGTSNDAFVRGLLALDSKLGIFRGGMGRDGSRLFRRPRQRPDSSTTSHCRLLFVARIFIWTPDIMISVGIFGTRVAIKLTGAYLRNDLPTRPK
ncbi:hypothetical protein TNCV_4738211 [Trichonephila clavipes]|nr:hypothetical protein TNCV_4738211 [Trichonephila clavipes]